MVNTELLIRFLLFKNDEEYQYITIQNYELLSNGFVSVQYIGYDYSECESGIKHDNIHPYEFMSFVYDKMADHINE